MQISSLKSLMVTHSLDKMAPNSRHTVRIICIVDSAIPVLHSTFPLQLMALRMFIISPIKRRRKDVFPDRGSPMLLNRTARIPTVTFPLIAFSYSFICCLLISRTAAMESRHHRIKQLLIVEHPKITTRSCSAHFAC